MAISIFFNFFFLLGSVLFNLWLLLLLRFFLEALCSICLYANE